MNTDNWVHYLVEVDGVMFVSKLDPKGSFYPKVEKLSKGVFDSWHGKMIRESVGDIANMTTEQIEARLADINEGYTQAVLCLA